MYTNWQVFLLLTNWGDRIVDLHILKTPAGPEEYFKNNTNVVILLKKIYIYGKLFV
jgi:hypothetical protein